MDLRLASLIAVAAIATGANANLIVNGSFEQLPAGGFNQGNWGLYSTIPGWYASSFKLGGVTYNNPIEVGLGSLYGVTGYSGNNILELDSTGNSQVNQNIDLARHQDYTLTFSYAMRAGTAPDTNSFEVLWDGRDIDNITPTSTAMTPVTLDVRSDGRHDLNMLSFRATGVSDSLGGEIDNVGLSHSQSVPEPCSLGALAVGAFGLWRRRKSA